jgi:hypothetical protein
MHRRLILAGVAATGGLLTSAFLQVAVAAGDAPSADGVDAFTIGGYTFDPYEVTVYGTPPVLTEGWAPVDPLTGVAPLLTIGGGTVFGRLQLRRRDRECLHRGSGRGWSCRHSYRHAGDAVG